MLFLYLYLSLPRIFKLWYTEPETRQKREENDDQIRSSVPGAVPCSPANLFGSAGKQERDRNEGTNTLCMNSHHLYHYKRHDQRGWHTIDTIFFILSLPNNPGDHTWFCLMSLCGLTKNINLDLVASTPLGIWEIHWSFGE